MYSEFSIHFLQLMHNANEWLKLEFIRLLNGEQPANELENESRLF